MKVLHRNIPLKKQVITGLVISMILMLLFSQGAAVYAIHSAPAEKTNKKAENSKKGEEAVLLLNATATVSSFQIHFEPLCKIAISVPEAGKAVKLIFCHFTGYFNNYFLTLFQFIIATKAP